MNIVLAVCAAVAALAGAGLLWWRSRVGREVALMASLQTSGAGIIAQLAPGTPVEVKGTLRVRSAARLLLTKRAKAKIVTIARDLTYTVAAGKRKTVTRTLSKDARRLLARGRARRGRPWLGSPAAADRGTAACRV